jgi:hypothetical protein
LKISEAEELQISNIEMINHTLRMDFSYSGGCGPAYLRMFIDTAIDLNNEPVIHLHPQFTDKDPCREVQEKTVYFDMAPVMRIKKKPYSFRVGKLEKLVTID